MAVLRIRVPNPMNLASWRGGRKADRWEKSKGPVLISEGSGMQKRKGPGGFV
jgi:hypothetical protein